MGFYCVNIDSANKYDFTLLIKAVNNKIINCNIDKYRKYNYINNIFWDKVYDSKKESWFYWYKRIYLSYTSKQEKY